MLKSFFRRLHLRCCICLISLYALLTSVILGLTLALNPCPLCILQRIALMWVFGWSAIAIWHSPSRFGVRVYSSLIFWGASLGLLAAIRQVYLQHLPPDQVPACGPSFLYLIQVAPTSKLLSSIFQGSGECAAVDGRLIGLSLAEWSLIIFGVLLVLSLRLFFVGAGGSLKK